MKNYSFAPEKFLEFIQSNPHYLEDNPELFVHNFSHIIIDIFFKSDNRTYKQQSKQSQYASELLEQIIQLNPQCLFFQTEGFPGAVQSVLSLQSKEWLKEPVAQHFFTVIIEAALQHKPQNWSLEFLDPEEAKKFTQSVALFTPFFKLLQAQVFSQEALKQCLKHSQRSSKVLPLFEKALLERNTLAHTDNALNTTKFKI